MVFKRKNSIYAIFWDSSIKEMRRHGTTRADDHINGPLRHQLTVTDGRLVVNNFANTMILIVISTYLW